MLLQRSWMRTMLRAGGAMLLLPAALLVSVALSSSVGGGLRGLGQVFVGPTVPEAAQAAESAPHQTTTNSATAAGGFPAIPIVRPVPSRLLADQTTPSRRRSSRKRGKSRKPSTKQPTTHVPATVTQPTGGQEPPGSQPPPQQPPQEGPIRQIGKVVHDAVASIPVAGPPAADVVQTVIDLVEPPPAPKPAVAVAQG